MCTASSVLVLPLEQQRVNEYGRRQENMGGGRSVVTLTRNLQHEKSSAYVAKVGWCCDDRWRTKLKWLALQLVAAVVAVVVVVEAAVISEVVAVSNWGAELAICSQNRLLSIKGRCYFSALCLLVLLQSCNSCKCYLHSLRNVSHKRLDKDNPLHPTFCICLSICVSAGQRHSRIISHKWLLKS